MSTCALRITRISGEKLIELFWFGFVSFRFYAKNWKPTPNLNNCPHHQGEEQCTNGGEVSLDQGWHGMVSFSLYTYCINIQVWKVSWKLTI